MEFQATCLVSSYLSSKKRNNNELMVSLNRLKYHLFANVSEWISQGVPDPQSSPQSERPKTLILSAYQSQKQQQIL